MVQKEQSQARGAIVGSVSFVSKAKEMLPQ
jgi:hypothetical protein